MRTGRRGPHGGRPGAAAPAVAPAGRCCRTVVGGRRLGVLRVLRVGVERRRSIRRDSADRGRRAADAPRWPVAARRSRCHRCRRNGGGQRQGADPAAVAAGPAAGQAPRPVPAGAAGAAAGRFRGGRQHHLPAAVLRGRGQRAVGGGECLPRDLRQHRRRQARHHGRPGRTRPASIVRAVRRRYLVDALRWPS